MLPKEVLLSFFPNITNKRYQKLIQAFFSLENAWKANEKEFEKLNWPEEKKREFIIWRKTVNQAKIQSKLEKEKIKYLTIADPDYPKLLREIYDPPFCLFIKGSTDLSGNNLAVVGPRKNTVYGKQITEKLINELSGYGINIISGLALGIDCVAHNSALKNNIKTIAVLGSGINSFHITPRSNYHIASKIIDSGGSVISEYAPGTPSEKFRFPERNRIIAGLCQAVLVVEAGKKSGALITASSAVDENREVLAIPQNINSLNSHGVNRLIQNGAKLVTSAADILEIFNLQTREKYDTNKSLKISELESGVLGYISSEPIDINDLHSKTKLTIGQINTLLVNLELRGIIQDIGSKNYILK